MNIPFVQGISYNEMPEENQEAVDRRTYFYSKQDFREETFDGQYTAIFYVGEGTMPEKILDEAVDFTKDKKAREEGIVTAKAIERVAEEVLEATDADTAIVYDRDGEKTVYQVDLKNPSAERARTLDIVNAVGEHYEDLESNLRFEEHMYQFEEALNQADLDLSQTVIDALQIAYYSLQDCKENSDIDRPNFTRQEDTYKSINSSQTDIEKVNKALKDVEVNTTPVFARTMTSDL